MLSHRTSGTHTVSRGQRGTVTAAAHIRLHHTLPECILTNVLCAVMHHDGASVTVLECTCVCAKYKMLRKLQNVGDEYQ